MFSPSWMDHAPNAKSVSLADDPVAADAPPGGGMMGRQA
jgi:hypothetical protein